ncbi:MAG: hypothetical protein ACFB9M_16995 [Myxococcota bacterium]
MTITPVVDQSGVRNADDLAIQEIAIHIADARLLGADPRIPVGGFALLPGPQLVRGGPGFVLELPFPETFLGQDDLAVYIRTEPCEEIDGASLQLLAGHEAPGSASRRLRFMHHQGSELLGSFEASSRLEAVLAIPLPDPADAANSDAPDGPLGSPYLVTDGIAVSDGVVPASD